MTKEQIIAKIENCLTRHGFKFTYYMDWLPMVEQNMNDYAGITFTTSLEFDQDSKTLYEVVHCQSRVCHMNGNATVEELRNAADQIVRAAQVMEYVNSQEFALAVKIGE